uniref:Uncharacterized protein n=1 Tax=Rhizophora mucronata TaxID=61149 RepID=A0A2P2N2E1_RHIMU
MRWRSFLSLSYHSCLTPIARSC